MPRSFRSPFRRGDTDPPDEPADTDSDESDAEADPTPEDAAEDGTTHEWIAYELHAWALEPRSMLAHLVTTADIPHSWQGTTLLVHESHEAAVDALVEEVEVAGEAGLDPDEPQTAFEMDGWSGELQASLASRLGATGVPHEFDEDGDLVVHESDEEHVELLIEDLLARHEEDGLDELEGLEANDLLSALFVATDRLRRDVHDSTGVLGVVEHGRRLSGSATPYGFGATTWRSLRTSASELVDLIESDDATDADVAERAHRLRDTLHQLV